MQYIVWNTGENETVWHKSVSDKYELIVPVDCTLKSEQFPGLHTDVRAVLTHNLRQAMDSLPRAIDESNNHNE